MKSPFPQDWKEYTIGDCLRRVEHPVEVDSDALYTQIGIRSHGKGLFYKEPVTGESLGNKAVYWVEPNCFILNIVFAWEQAIGKTTQAEVGLIGSHRFPMYKPVNNLIDIDYLVYYLLTKRGTDILEAASPGGAGRNRTLGQDRFMKSRIVLPLLDEQQKIAKILSTQDKAIELQGRKIEELKRFKKGCLEKMFPRKGQKVPEKRFPGFTDDWEQRKLRELAIFNPKAELPDTFEYVDLESVVGTEMLSHRTESKQSAPSRAQRLAQTGDLFYQTVRPYQKNNYLFEKPDKYYVFSTGYAQMRPVVDGRFLLCLVQNDRFVKVVLDNCTGTSYPAINSNDLAEIDVYSPNNPQEQKQIGDFFKDLDNLIALHQRKLEEMKKQKKALMQLLLTGIVRVQS